jgi:hypothetical protein
MQVPNTPPIAPPRTAFAPMQQVAPSMPATVASRGASINHAAQSDRARSRIARTKQRVRRFTLEHRTLSVVLLILILVPTLLTLFSGIAGLVTYSSLKTHASNGVHDLLAVKSVFTGAKNHPTNVMDPHRLALAKQDFEQARGEFLTTQQMLKQSFVIQGLNQYLPVSRSTISSAIAACQMASDVSEIGSKGIDALTALAPRLHGSSLLSNAKGPLLTQTDFNMLGTTITNILPLVNDMQNQSHNLSLAALPVSAQQRTQLTQLLPYLPQADQALTLVKKLLPEANWLLGIGTPRTFLVQTLDSGELRATGGFTGQYGELNINGGRVGPFSLHNIGLVEYANGNPTMGAVAPSAYRSWWPFANWGLRDSNLSADFPTSAKLAIEQYAADTNHQVDGAITITPVMIQHVLQVTGPIHIPQYGETITAQNLEAKLHYYQLDNKGIRKEELVEKVYNPDQARKLFTARLAKELMQNARQAPPQEILALGKQVLTDLKSRDLQVYATNPQVEGLLQQYGFAGEMDRSTKHDGLYVVQMNLSASKASQYVQSIMNDTVTLDSSGGALHQFNMRLAYNQRGPVYGLDTYRDYMRFYVPTNAQFRSGDGFDTGTALCGGVLGACPADGIYPNNELVCPPGGYDAGASAPMLGDPYAGEYHPLDTIGPPTNMQSDEPGRAMFGGWVVIPKNCTMNISLSWYVPAQQANSPYALLFQRQASVYPQYSLSIQTAPGTCSSGTSLKSSGTISQDTAFTLDTGRTHNTSSPGCKLTTSHP